MKNPNLILSLALIFLMTSCNSNEKQVQNNIGMYTQTWDDIINQGNLDLINNTNFDDSITMVYSPENIVGIDDFKAYYSNFVTGFSNVEFTIVDVFGQGDKLVKHWRFKGKHSGDFFGIPATNNEVDVEGVTLVEMKEGKIAQEQDFMDNMVFLQQLGIVSLPENVTIIDGVYKAFAKGDVESVLATMDSTVVWNEAENFPYADGNPYIAPESVVNGVLARIGNEWEYWHLVDLKLHEMSNNMVLATGRYQAKYKKNGAIIDLQMAHLWTLDDGKIVAFQQFADTKGITDAIKK